MPRLPRALPVIFCALMTAQPLFPQEQGTRARDHAAERAEYQRSGRTAKGENAADLLHRGYQQKMMLRKTARQRQAAAKAQQESGRAAPEHNTPTFSNLVWQSLGPSPAVFDPSNFSAYGNVTGRVSAVAVDPNDPSGNTVYVGGASGGVWKSTNAATSDPNAVVWTPMTDDQASLAVGSIAVQPGGGVVLVGTGETNSTPDSYYGQGILRSTDGGHTWTLIPSANSGTRPLRGLGFSKIAFSTTNPNLVVATAASTNASSPGGNGGETQGANGRGIYFSTNAGSTWTYASVVDPTGPTQPGSAGDVVFNPVQQKFYAVLRWHGYYSSTDGAMWTRLANQPGLINSTNCPASPTDNTCPEYRGSLSVREDTGEVYTIFVDANDQTTADGGGIFVLSQDGGTWSQMGQAGIDNCQDTGGGCGTEQGSYNLYIRAVPNGANTDLYVGAINIFKCSRSASNPFCSNANSWLNLTHVYGCTPYGAPAGVHPDQHAMDFAKTSSPTHVYFGNDGGVWRALDETALASGSCAAGSNPFDNLNATMGSLSEFVSFSQHPSDAGTILGGLQDNGSPALVPGNSGADGKTWQGVNDSDGGYNDIDPLSPNILYTSIFNVSVRRCTAGTACNQGTWNTVAGPGQVDSDGALFYPPWMLDPQNNNNLWIGTCRLWRGAAAGGSYFIMSMNFSQQRSTQCGGSGGTGDTKVRSIAMGGPGTTNGSQVVYAGMAGAAPLNGHVFVTTSADTGVTSWNDRTGSINPSGYDVSDIAISPYDPTGKTAYLTIMGFGTPHIYKTTDAGVSWSDKSGNLPDVPANAIAVDPVTPNTLYVGTDVGVFLSIDDGATWAEFGSGLPNAPAVKVKTFVSGGVKKLRAATYGRGMWQIDLPQPDIMFSSAALNFSTVVGRTSQIQLATLQNNSANAVSITNISAAFDFVVNSGCPPVLNAGASCTVAVSFAPRTAGAFSTALTLTSSAAGGNRTLPLSGTGVDFNLSALGPRPGRPHRSGTQTNNVITMAHSETVTAELALGVTGALAPDSLTGLDKNVQLGCSAAGLRCSVTPAAMDLSQPGPVRVAIAAGAAKARRVRAVAAETHTVQVRATVGGVSRSVDLTVVVR